MKKKIMHIVSTGKLSGAEKVLSDICSNLSQDFEAIAICCGDELKKYYEEKGIKTYVFNINPLNISEVLRLRNFVKKQNIDLIHAHDVKPSIVGSLISDDIPVISHIHGTYPWLKQNGFMKKIDCYFRKKYFLNIACSEEVKNYYLEHNTNCKYDKVIVLSNAFNFAEFNNIELKNKNEIKKELNIANDDFIFGYVGRLIRLKGVDLLIKSFAELLNQNNDKKMKLLIVGDGVEKENLISIVKSYDIEKQVIFTGYKNNIYDYMNVMDCFILPSIREGLPMVLLEAVAMNKAIISTPVAGVNELILSEDYGIVLKERNLELMVNAMNSAINNTNDLEIKSKNAHNRLLDKFDIKNYLICLEKIYNKALKNYNT